MQKATCVWPGCRKHPEDADLPICDKHARFVHRHMDGRMGLLRDERAAIGAPRNPVGVVYYLEVGDLVKVGFSVRLADRMSAYPPGAVLLATEPGPKSLERTRHLELRNSLVRGREWFARTPEVEARIAAALDAHGTPRQPAGRRVRYPVTVTHVDD